MLCPFSRTTVIGSPLESMTVVAMGTLKVCSIRHEFLPVHWAVNLIPKWLVIHTSHATITLLSTP